MNRELNPEEKRLIEREFVARQDAAAKRRKVARLVALVGLTAGIVAAGLRTFRIAALAPPLLWLAWLLSVLVYVGLGVFPSSAAKDLDPRWHLNPWQQALQNLSEGRTQIEAVALLAGPTLARVLFLLVALALG